MDRLVKGNPARARLPRTTTSKTGSDNVVSCPHSLAAWRNRPRRSLPLYPDGNPRPINQVGGKLTRKTTPCNQRPGHHLPQPWNDGQPTPHQTPDGRVWE